MSSAKGGASGADDHLHINQDTISTKSSNRSGSYSQGNSGTATLASCDAGSQSHQDHSVARELSSNRINRPGASGDIETRETDEDSESTRREIEVRELARQLTRHSVYSTTGQNPFTPE